MNEEIKGKRFSRIKITKPDSDSRKDQFKFAEYLANTHPTEWRTFENVILGATIRATDILKKADLPISPIYEDENGQYLLDSYVIKKRNFKHDSPEGLAAKILSNIELLKTPGQKNNISMLAFELGELTTLLKVYSTESSGNTGNAKKDRPKPWRDDFIKHLCLNYPDNKLYEYWDLIPSILDDKNYESPFSEMYVDWDEKKQQDCLYHKDENGTTQKITNKTIQNNIAKYKASLNK